MDVRDTKTLTAEPTYSTPINVEDAKALAVTPTSTYTVTVT
jgi:hypothetical protein